jgi:hypothetical protein
MPPLRAVCVAAALLMATGCTMAGESAVPIAPPAAASITVRCTETPATAPDGRPAVLANSTSAWFGQGDLWVGLPDYPALVQGDTLVLRFPWVTLANGVATSALGSPAVSAHRSDGPGDAVGQVSASSRAFGTGELSFWPATVAFPSPGCWTVTGAFGATVVQFVVEVRRP